MRCFGSPDGWILTIMLAIKIAYSSHILLFRYETYMEFREETKVALAQVSENDGNIGKWVCTFSISISLHFRLRLREPQYTSCCSNNLGA